MASTYSTNLAIELIGTGDQAGTWGVTTNSNLGTLIEQAISGYVTQAVATGTDTTITIPNGATGVARNMYIELTGTGGTNTNLIVPSNKKLYFIFNNSTGAVTVKVTGQTGVSVPQGKKMILVSNGTDIVNGINYIADFGTNSFTVTNLTASSATITNLIATTASVSDASATVLRASSATLTHLSATSASITNLALTSLTISSLNITNVSVASATVSSNLTLSGGTANGVLYLNGSKVATSGSALVFDGTNLNLNSGTAVSATSGGSVTAGVFAARAPLSAHQTAAGVLQYSANETTLRSYGATGVTGALVFNLGAGGSADAEYMRLTSTGLGIGTSSPAFGLSVQKDNGSGYVALFRKSESDPALAIQTTSGITQIQGLNSAISATNDIAFQLSGGNLGIGTSSPAAKLHVAGQTRIQDSASASNYILIGSGDNAPRGGNSVMAQTGSMVMGTEAASNLIFITNAAEAGRFDSSGNLGIGTSSPGDRIHAAAATAAGLSLQATGTGGSTWRILSTDNAASLGGGYLGFNNGSYRMVLDGLGNLGLGVTPSAWSSDFGAVLQLKSAGSTGGGALTGSSGDNFRMFANTFYDGAYKRIVSGYATQYEQAAGKHIWYTAGTSTANSSITFTQALTLDASGNLLVGATSSSGKLTIKNPSASGEQNILKIQNASSTGDLGGFTFNQTDDMFKMSVISSVGYLAFGTGASATERARITAGGDLLIGTTTYQNKRVSIDGGSSGGVWASCSTSSNAVNVTYNSATTGDNVFEEFYTDGGPNLRGSITYNRGAGQVAYNVTSDVRLKENISDAAEAGSKIDAMQVRQFDWKETGNHLDYGFVAQELHTVAPHAVSKPEDDDKMWSVDYSKLVPMLVKEIQSLRARVAQLEAK